jgi:hypothetical protein
MSSETSTERLHGKAGADAAVDTANAVDTDFAPGTRARTGDGQGLQPWQFFVLAALGCATAVTFMIRGQGIMAVILLAVLMAGAALVGMAALRTFGPLVSKDEDRTVMIGQRTRAALEREKMLALRAIKELEFDRAMGKLSEQDWKEMSGRLRARAGTLLRQLDAGAGYRDQIERDLAKRIGQTSDRSPKAAARGSICSACSTANDQDARFCKSCGRKLA